MFYVLCSCPLCSSFLYSIVPCYKALCSIFDVLRFLMLYVLYYSVASNVACSNVLCPNF